MAVYCPLLVQILQNWSNWFILSHFSGKFSFQRSVLFNFFLKIQTVCEFWDLENIQAQFLEIFARNCALNSSLSWTRGMPVFLEIIFRQWKLPCSTFESISDGEVVHLQNLLILEFLGCILSSAGPNTAKLLQLIHFESL